MSTSCISVKCSSCGGMLTIEQDRKEAFCTYCGTKVVMSNGNEYIYRHIDEASIKRAETEQIVSLKQMEMAEKKRVSEEKNKKRKIIISIGMGVIGILMMVGGYLSGSSTGDPDSGFYMISLFGFFPLLGTIFIWTNSKDKDNDASDGRVAVPSTIDNYENKHYQAIKTVFESAGFTNIKSVPLNDLRLGILKKPGMVESICINGKSITTGGKRYLPTAAVVISYHSLMGR